MPGPEPRSSRFEVPTIKSSSAVCLSYRQDAPRALAPAMCICVLSNGTVKRCARLNTSQLRPPDLVPANVLKLGEGAIVERLASHSLSVQINACEVLVGLRRR
jgi:hypothetical protein